jgi:hypothetical protein
MSTSQCCACCAKTRFTFLTSLYRCVLTSGVNVCTDHDYDDDYDADRPKTIYDSDDLAAAASSRAAYYHGYNEWLLGDFHGFQPEFSGIGVIFDTYANEGHYNHKDITLVVNDRCCYCYCT